MNQYYFLTINLTMPIIFKSLFLLILIVSLIPNIVYFHHINEQKKISEDLYSAAGICIAGHILLFLIPITFYILIGTKNKMLSIIPLGLIGILSYTLYVFNFRRVDTTLSTLNLVINYITLFISLLYAYKISV